jgi:hypothetical protein
MTTFRSIASRSEIETALSGVVGEECWAIIAGPGTGSVILLDFGAKLPREHKLHNDALSDEEREFESSYSVHIWCSWRVETATEIVGSWVAMQNENWWDRSGLARLKGRSLTRFNLRDGIPDLRLDFGELHLSLFPDTLSENEDDCAYTLRTRDEVFVVFANGKLEREWVEL